MEKQLKLLEKYYGTPDKVADALGISLRQYYRIKASGSATDTITILIQELVGKIQYLKLVK